jgi:hypothetical protein
MITRHARVAVGSFFACLLSMAASMDSANAGVTIGLVLNPPTTAGGGATRTKYLATLRSGRHGRPLWDCNV